MDVTICRSLHTVRSLPFPPQAPLVSLRSGAGNEETDHASHDMPPTISSICLGTVRTEELETSGNLGSIHCARPLSASLGGQQHSPDAWTGGKKVKRIRRRLGQTCDWPRCRSLETSCSNIHTSPRCHLYRETWLRYGAFTLIYLSRGYV